MEINPGRLQRTAQREWTENNRIRISHGLALVGLRMNFEPLKLFYASFDPLIIFSFVFFFSAFAMMSAKKPSRDSRVKDSWGFFLAFLLGNEEIVRHKTTDKLSGQIKMI